jgi:hypothetical protein
MIEHEPSLEKKQVKTEYSFFDSRANSYFDYLQKTNNTFGVHSLKPSPLRNSLIKQTCNITNNLKASNVSINDLMFNDDLIKLDFKNTSSLFGSIVNFRIHKSEQNFQRGIRDTTISLYSPKQLFITSPLINNLKERFPLCDANNFKIEWNSDNQNSNGLYIAIKYDRMNSVGVKGDNLIRNINFIERDNGSYIIDPTMFADIPNMAFIDIILLRGNIEVATINNESYKFLIESHASIKVILVKNRDKIIVR